jgi:hypothetical protein
MRETPSGSRFGRRSEFVHALFSAATAILDSNGGPAAIFLFPLWLDPEEEDRIGDQA